MSKAILTIDDAPSKITPQIVDYLNSRNIVPIINFVGSNIEEYFEEAIYVAQSDIVIGNHSYSHPHFSELSIDECRREILKTEEQINRVYQAANKERKHRVFRFPYGDKGGSNEAVLQKMLANEFHFERLDDSNVNFTYWKENHLDKDIDMLWTYDFAEYEMTYTTDVTWDTVISRIANKECEAGASIYDENSTSIILIHDHEATDNIVGRYYEKLIDYVLKAGVEFVTPAFVATKPALGEKCLRNMKNVLYL